MRLLATPGTWRSPRPFCRRQHGRASGPQLWPAATKRFPNCPRARRNRSDIGQAFSELCEFRNRIAHHQPIWDRDPLGRFHSALERLGWMNSSLAAVARDLSCVETLHREGLDAFRSMLSGVLAD